MKMTVHQGDITQCATDAIVNAANVELKPGGGVCGAIHHAAGPGLAEDCARIGLTLTGKAVITPGYRLRAPWVIHAVGPTWMGGKEKEPLFLHCAYFRSLTVARLNGLRTIAFPCISTGIYGYPPDLACGVALMAVADFARTYPGAIDEVVFCCFSQADADRYRVALGGA